MYINNDINYLEYLKDRDIFLFGYSQKGKECFHYFVNNDYKVVAFIDNDCTKHGMSNEGVPIIPLNQLVETSRSKYMIIITSRCEREIKKQLMENEIYNYISESQIDFGGGEEYYDEQYFSYQQKMGVFGGKIKAKVFLPYVSENTVVVEFGSGGGYLLNNLPAKDRLGVEINDSARECAENLGIKSVKYISEIPDEYADVIISTSVLEHVENPMGILRELRAKLKKGGKIVFHVPNESCETEYSRSEVNNHLYTWNCLNIGNLFKAAGYFVYSVQRVQEIWPKNYLKIEEEISRDLFEDICSIGGKAFDANRCIIVGIK